MSSIAEAFRTGGVWMYLILFATLCGLALTGLLTVATAIKRRAPWVLWAITPVFVLLIGLLGHYIGLSETLTALERATPETRMKLLARGISLSLNASAFGAFSAAFLSALSALGLGLGGLISAGKPRQWTPLPAALAGGLGLLATGVIMAGAITMGLSKLPSVGLFLFAGVSASVLVNLSMSEEHKARVASLRLGVGSLLILGGASLGLGQWTIGKIEMFEALERATPQMRLELVNTGLSLAKEGGLFIGVGLVVAALLFGVLPALTSIKESLNTRGFISAALGALLLLAGLGVIGASASGNATPKDRIVLPVQAIQFMEQTPGPQAPAELNATLTEAALLPCILSWDGQAATLASGNTAIDSNPCVEDAMPGFNQEGCPSKEGALEGPLCSGLRNLPTLISPQLEAKPFLTHQWSSGLTQRFLVLLGGASTGALSDPLMFKLSWQGLVGMRLELINSGGGAPTTAWLVQPTSQPDELKLRSPGQASAVMISSEALEELYKATDPRERPALILVPAPKWTMQQLVDRCGMLSNIETTHNLESRDRNFRCHVWPADDATVTQWHTSRLKPAEDSDEQAPRLNGPLTRELIKNIIQGHQPQIKSCYETELKKNPKLAGQVTLRFEIGAAGVVTNAKISADTTKNKKLGRCIVKEALTWSFPAPDDGKPKTINYPFTFKAQ